MALMTQIRNNLTKAFGVFAALFIVYIVLDWGMDFAGRRGRGMLQSELLGKVNGKEISYRYFSDLVRRAVESQKKQSGIDVDEETERQIRSQVWNQVVDDILIDQEIDHLGITVTDQEIRDIVQGPNPPDFLVRQFRDSTGTFRRDAYEQAMFDPQNKQVWIQVEDIVRQEQRRKKLQSILLATVQVSESEIRQQFIDKNITLNADYVLFDANQMVSDSAVTLTPDDLKHAYSEHPENFKTKASRKLKYVLFTQHPSSADSLSVYNESLRLFDQAKSNTSEFIDLAKQYSDIPVNEVFFKHGELSSAKETAVFSAKVGDIVGPIKDADGFHIIKIIDQHRGKAEYVKASHILINAISGPDSMKALQKAKDIFKRAKAGSDFAGLAQMFSEDYSSGRQGGELGWATKGKYVKPFEDALFHARVGDIIGPIRTQFGWHIIKAEGKDNREIKLIDLALKIKASSETIDNINQQAQDFAYLTKDEGFEKAAENSKFEIQETQEFTKGGVIPGIGISEALSHFAFDNSIGAISEPMVIRTGLVVCKVSTIREEGLRPLQEVKPIVHNMALHEKKIELLRPQVDEFYKTLTPTSDIIAAAQLVPNSIAQKTYAFKPGDAIYTVGRDLKFVGTALALQVGEISKPFEGARGYYIMKLTSRTNFDSTQYNIEKNNLHEQLMQEKRNSTLTLWQTNLHEKADIEDNRDKFYR